MTYEKKSVDVGRAIFALDIFSTIIAFVLSFYLGQSLNIDTNPDFFSHIALIPLLLTFMIGFLSYFGAYKSPRNQNMVGYSWAAFRAVSLSIAALLTLLFLLKIQYVSRSIIVQFAIIELIFVMMIRGLIKWYFIKSVRKGDAALNVIIIGTGERAKELSVELHKQSEWGIKILGHLDPDPARVGSEVNGVRVIGTTDEISKFFKKMVVDEVIIAITRSMLVDAEPIAQACEEEGITLRFMADVFSLHVARISLFKAGSLPLLTLEPVAQDDMKLIVKRTFDLVLTLASMPILLPIMGIIAIAIKIDSRGPALFVQQRVGLRKRLFPLFKFRSMHEDAEIRLKEIEHLNEADGPIFKMKNDPRVTTVGRFLRKTSLDELPQLFNVIRGEMSLVGPRPMSLRDVDLFDRGIQRKRFSVKPGITCIWQISGRSNLPFNKWLELDLKYIENWSLFLDLKILIKTLPAVIKGSGAV